MWRTALVPILALGLLLLASTSEPLRVEVIGDSLSNNTYWFLYRSAPGFDPGELVGYNPGMTCQHIRETEFTAEFDPTVDVLVLQCGTNDSKLQYDLDLSEDAVRSMVEESLAAGARVVLAVPPLKVPPSPHTSEINDRILEIRNRWYGIAHDFGAVEAADVLEAFFVDEAWTIPAGEPGSLYSPDGIHPSYPDGNALMGETVLRALRVATWACHPG